MLQGTYRVTEIKGAEFALHTESYGIPREANTSELAWERILDVKRHQTAFPIRTTVTHCLGVNVKSYLRSRLQSLRHSKNTYGKKILAFNKSCSKLRD